MQVYSPLQYTAGVRPESEGTETSTLHYINADKIRFKQGLPQKIGGWEEITFDLNATISGTVRGYFSENIDGSLLNILGSHTCLYSLKGTRLVNISPLKTATIAAADSLDTQYVTLSSNPISTVDGSTTITFNTAEAARLRGGDNVTLSGFTSVAGIPTGDINKLQVVRSATSTTFTVIVATAANATTSGGGASGILASGLVRLNKTAHGLSGCQRVKVTGATAFGGITTGQINAEHILRNISTNYFEFMTDGVATSAVTGGGGASTEYQEQIDAGLLNEQNVQGYGAGLYGVGLYGTALISSTARAYPRIWFLDRYGDTVIMSPGNQGGVYQWSGDTDVAPTLVSNAPTKVNYAFISDNILVTFGADTGSGEIENRIFASDLADITNWTSSSTNQVFDDDIEGAGRLISHCPVDGLNLIFTNYKTYTFRYIGLPAVWEIQLLDNAIGIIAPNARVSVKGIAFWMGLDNFYMWRGGKIETIPANSQNESTVKNYVFNDLNYGQKSKCFAWYNRNFNELWFHYPSATSMEPNRVAVCSLDDFSWTIHQLDRTAAEYPSSKNKTPRLVNEDNLYQHEVGSDASGSALSWTLTSPKSYYEKPTTNLLAIIPDSNQSGNITFKHEAWLFPQSASVMYSNTTTITPTTERVPIVNNGRFYQFTWSGSELGQDWRMGAWFEEIQKGSEE